MVNAGSDDDSAARLADVTAFLAGRGVVATAREFRLRQEFTRHGWDVRVRQAQEVLVRHRGEARSCACGQRRLLLA